MTPPGDRTGHDPDAPRRTWSSLTPGEQLDLREAYGRHLDQLPATCDFDTKVARFERWLLERGVSYDGPR